MPWPSRRVSNRMLDAGSTFPPVGAVVDQPTASSIGPPSVRPRWPRDTCAVMRSPLWRRPTCDSDEPGTTGFGVCMKMKLSGAPKFAALLLGELTARSSSHRSWLDPVMAAARSASVIAMKRLSELSSGFTPTRLWPNASSRPSSFCPTGPASGRVFTVLMKPRPCAISCIATAMKSTVPPGEFEVNP